MTVLLDPNYHLAMEWINKDLFGWGGDDCAIYDRIIRKKVPIYYPPNLHNNGFILEDKLDNDIGKDTSRNQHNISLGKRDDISTNGASTCTYTICKEGEFHCDNIYHYLVLI